MDNKDTYRVMVKYNLLSFDIHCKLCVGSDSFWISDDMSVPKKYLFQNMDRVGLYKEYGIVYFKNGSLFVFKGTSKDLSNNLLSPDFAITKKILRKIDKRADEEKRESLDNRTAKVYRISLIDSQYEITKVYSLKVDREFMEILDDDRLMIRIPYSKLLNVKMLSEFGLFIIEYYEIFRFVSGEPGKVKTDKMTLIYTQMILDTIKRAKSLNLEHLLLKSEDSENGKESAVVKIVKRKAYNQHYWKIYEKSALRSEEENLSSLDEIGLRTSAKHLFQNAVCFCLLGKLQESEEVFERMKSCYKEIHEKRYGSTDLFRLFTADYLFESFDDMTILFKAVTVLKERKYRDDIDEKNTGSVFIKPVDRKIKKIYRLIDLLHLGRICFIVEDYNEAAQAVKSGLEIIYSIKADVTFFDSYSETASGLEVRIELYERMFSILSGLIREITQNHETDRTALPEELPLFFDEYINPLQKKISYFSIEEEVQWALIYFLSCQRIPGLFYDIPHHVALRKFLG